MTTTSRRSVDRHATTAAEHPREPAQEPAAGPDAITTSGAQPPPHPPHTPHRVETQAWPTSPSLPFPHRDTSPRPWRSWRTRRAGATRRTVRHHPRLRRPGQDRPSPHPRCCTPPPGCATPRPRPPRSPRPIPPRSSPGRPWWASPKPSPRYRSPRNASTTTRPTSSCTTPSATSSAADSPTPGACRPSGCSPRSPPTTPSPSSAA